MTRPSTHADLSVYQRRGATLFSWNVALAEQPEVEQWIVKAKLQARKQGFEFDYNEVRVPLTEAELDKRLVDAQQKYDNGIEFYADVVSGVKTYAELEQDDPLRETAMQASFLRASLFTSVVAFGVALMAIGVGAAFVLICLALRCTSRAAALTGCGR
jgi:hypothetical protein